MRTFKALVSNLSVRLESGDDSGINQGIAYLNFSTPLPEKRTLVVIGPPRSGTSMVAKVLTYLDVPMGVPKDGPANYEDPEFVDLLHTSIEGNVAQRRLRALIAVRNEQYDVWGFKVPMAVVSLRTLAATLRNPYFVIIFRDVLAGASRNQISTDAPLLDSLSFYSSLYGVITHFTEHTKLPCMLVSYEKAILAPSMLSEGIARFAGVNDKTKITQAANQIQPNNPGYLGLTKACPVAS